MFTPLSNIMIVDDAIEARMIVKGYLTHLGFLNIMEESTAEEAIVTLKSFASAGILMDLLILDWKLPGKDGIELFLQMKGDGELKNIPVLMISGKNESHDIIKAIALGIADYLIKPFTVDVLLKKMASVWSKTHAKKP